MGFYLSPLVGSGTPQDPFRPLAADAGPGWNMVDLRPDASVLDGYAFVYTPQSVSSSKVRQIADSKLDQLSLSTRSFIENRLGTSLSDTRTDNVIGKLLVSPPSGKWRALSAVRSRMRFEVWLGPDNDPLLWVKSATLGPQGELIDPSDDFNRADENPIGAPWVTAAGSVGAITIASNQLAKAASGSAMAYYSGATATADQFAELVTPSSAGTRDGGPAVRIDGAAFNAYWYDAYTGKKNGVLGKWVGGTFTSLASTNGTSIIANGDTLRVEAEGSTVRAIRNGTTQYTVTDTSISAAGGGAGVYLENGSAVWDSWQGGDLGSAAQSVSVSGRGSAAAYGAVNPSVGGVSVLVSGLGTAADFGVVGVSATGGAQSCSVAGLGSVAAFGSVAPAPGGVTVALTGEGSAAAFGVAPKANQRFVTLGLSSAAQFGLLTIVPGNTDIVVGGVDSAAQFGVVTTGGGIGPTFSPAIHGGFFF